MTLKSSIYRKSSLVGLQIIHEAWRMLWDYLVTCTPVLFIQFPCICDHTEAGREVGWPRLCNENKRYATYLKSQDGRRMITF